jgi:hypothetical protein
LELEKLKNQLD